MRRFRFGPAGLPLRNEPAILRGVDDRDDYAEPGLHDPLPGSPMLAFAIVGLLLLIGLLPVWWLVVAELLGLGPID